MSYIQTSGVSGIFSFVLVALISAYTGAALAQTERAAVMSQTSESSLDTDEQTSTELTQQKTPNISPVKNAPSESPSKAPPKLTVKINLSKEATAELTEKVTQQLAIGNLKTDEYPAQTNFLYQRAEGELITVLKALGYYQPTITSQLQRKPNLTEATFDIQLGQPVTIRTIDIVIEGEDKDLPSWRQFQKFQLALRPKAIFKHSDYTSTVSALTNIAVNEGYMDAEFTQREFKVYPHLNAVDIHLHLDTQNAYQFGKVNFSGSQQVSTDFLNRFVGFIPGDTYRQSDINALQKGLIDSNYFGLIRVAPQYSQQKERRIPINVELEDNLKHRYEVGGGYGTDTGARILFGFENRLVNQYGHNYQVDSLLGERAQNLSFNYRIPGRRPAVQHWNLGVDYDATQSDSLSRTLTGLSAEYNYQINPEWLINPFISLETESFQYVTEPSFTTQTLLVGTTLKNRWVNNDAYPTEGFSHAATIRASIDNVISDSQFLQLELSTHKVYSIMEFWRLHAGLQTTLTLADQDQIIPATYLTLLGGENLRGYKFESIGIQTEDGSVVGARNSISGSIETDYRMTQYLGLGVFSDFGQVFDDQRTEDWKIGAGLGIRGYTPVGMAKLDIAWPVSEEDASNWRLHFSLGFDL
ncbi:MAG: BamA/TamA family outer membrane protein [Thiotrichales bacterium]|nr:BamA/TamA family outer membrane protein [Thiotrichales bacterium]